MVLWWPRVVFLKFGKSCKCNQYPGGNIALLRIKILCLLIHVPILLQLFFQVEKIIL